MIDITEIVTALIGLSSIIITSFIVPLIRQKVTAEEWNNIILWTSTAVQAAEVIIKGSGLGEKKRAYVLKYVEEMCKTHNIRFNSKSVRLALESSWKNLIKSKEALRNG